MASSAKHFSGPDAFVRQEASPEGTCVTRGRAFGTNMTLAVTDPGRLRLALEILRGVIDETDRACSRFRADSEIWALYERAGTDVVVSTALFDAIATAREMAERTDGAVDLTVGAAVEALGYDRDFAEVREAAHPATAPPVGPAPGWWRVEMDRANRSVRLPRGVRLDLGASAKALAVDRAADAIASSQGCGVLVDIGGDVSVEGEPPGRGWAVGVSLDSSTPVTAVGHVVSISSGGLASSSTAVRTWRRGGCPVHHIVDPRTGEVADDYWKLVTVAAASCVEANAASTAAVVWGPGATGRLEALGLPARLVRRDGEVVTVGGWPPDLMSM